MKNKYNVIHNGLKKREFSLTSSKKLGLFLIKHNPKIIINCAAITDIDYCEKYPKKSFQINANLLSNIFKIRDKNNLNFKLIQFSTDQLYDSKLNVENKEITNVKFNNIYAKHKYLAENTCLKNKSLIFRTNFFGKNKKNITNWIYNQFRSKNKKFYLFNDVYFSPLRVIKIAEIIGYLIKSNLYSKEGIYNLGSKRGLSKCDFAISFAKKLNIYNPKKFDIVNSSKYLLTKRSKHMKMSVKKFEKTFKFKLDTLENEIKYGSKEYKKI